MAALSIASVNAQAREDVSEHIRLELDRSAGVYKWIYRHGTTTNFAVVPDAAKIRDLKMKDWLDHARALLARVNAGETAPIALPKEERPAEPMPSFMIVGKPANLRFDPDPEAQGYNDARRGITSCPYSIRQSVDRWNRGHDRAFAEGLADRQRFSLTAGGRR